MKRVFLAFVLTVTIGFCFCRPRYIAIPLEDVEFLEMSELSRPLARQPRAPQQMNEYPTEPNSEKDRYLRQANSGHHEYVDYGAHTGHHGSFGWYADFPVHKGS